jgi:hypothetical protein
MNSTPKLLDGADGSSEFFEQCGPGITGGSAGPADHDVSIGLASGISQMTRSQSSPGTILRFLPVATLLQSIAQFYDSNGVFVLETPKSINIRKQ